ncbi:hypothetical protein ACIBIZ_35435 [Nonomuraea spiralis]|uniref:hypothetical protein n=1 Tax=Nonomuraea spiralis TaxID=46182 RepID=UPI0037B06F95
MPPSPGDVVRRLLDAANAHDLDAVLRCSTELTATGTHTGPYLTVGGELLAPPGGHISVRGCWFSHLRDDLVAGQHLYYDQLEIYAPLGLRLPLSFGDDGA